MTIYVLKDDFSTMDDYGADVSGYTSETIYGVFDSAEPAEKALAKLEEVAYMDDPSIENRERFTIVEMELNQLTDAYDFMTN